MTALAIILASVAAVVLAAEVYARVVLGLGDPPLWRADPEIEYLPVPSRSYRRFGNRVSYNAWSMRSGDFPREKASPDEVRVLVLGDSLVNGGVHVDQDALATSLLEQWLRGGLGRSVVVGNVSAGSWGPPNYLAYISGTASSMRTLSWWWSTARTTATRLRSVRWEGAGRPAARYSPCRSSGASTCRG